MFLVAFEAGAQEIVAATYGGVQLACFDSGNQVSAMVAEVKPGVDRVAYDDLSKTVMYAVRKDSTGETNPSSFGTFVLPDGEVTTVVTITRWALPPNTNGDLKYFTFDPVRRHLILSSSDEYMFRLWRADTSTFDGWIIPASPCSPLSSCYPFLPSVWVNPDDGAIYWKDNERLVACDFLSSGKQADGNWTCFPQVRQPMRQPSGTTSPLEPCQPSGKGGKAYVKALAANMESQWFSFSVPNGTQSSEVLFEGPIHQASATAGGCSVAGNKLFFSCLWDCGSSEASFNMIDMATGQQTITSATRAYATQSTGGVAVVSMTSCRTYPAGKDSLANKTNLSWNLMTCALLSLGAFERFQRPE